ncbi:MULTISPECIES: hypothetical protein [unclassified Neorhizobium]|uniref:hypothetical protein n=1 Tax=unclassified Neorhizobium TaxID=2629175 RepID=UPI001FF6B02C|nr:MULTISPECIES: hypothetical protein [unclassified Neorhizobium]MCJ9668510.1 hypothetical protein [Neorhizobium sp. SHOUNA12B]MCJ9743959.1 hypothetical protein [Neorhizobium sp. SHOUNA12A]
MAYQLLIPLTLIPTEETDPRRVEEVREQILTAGRWTLPIMVEKDALFVMDGHHRLAVALQLGLNVIPSVLLDYETVQVEAWRAGETITPEHIFDIVRRCCKFPIKTTRHIFKGELPACNVPLEELRRNPDLSKVSVPTPQGGMLPYPT